LIIHDDDDDDDEIKFQTFTKSFSFSIFIIHSINQMEAKKRERGEKK
jgi:hypothetical protein